MIININRKEITMKTTQGHLSLSPFRAPARVSVKSTHGNSYVTQAKAYATCLFLTLTLPVPALSRSALIKIKIADSFDSH